ncbi:L-serine ammonia-lyase [Leptolinea tardivitalis]|uniref:L-serine dehydratase n=1 Tax=Leptolinea tardivitalis TaxID=229920 RepID=A0A0P6X1H4_9CHLR|nr:L-serine ammonia-lyase [Leptolinea tardivitalis]KPL73220.1 serine dehydratase [Leptolinea tardivitalis]GAP21325.1 L-serine ammonia-lyase [Leptolinea tardivitalis]
MESIRELYRIGHGPSSSHTMAPRRAAEMFFDRNNTAVSFRVTLYGSLAATGRGHLTDKAIQEAAIPKKVEFIWKPEINLPLHPVGMEFEALDADGKQTSFWRVYSPGGGALLEEGEYPAASVYPHSSMSEILKYCTSSGLTFWEYVEACEGKGVWDYLREVNRVMHESIQRGIQAEGVLPGGLGVSRRAWTFHRKSMLNGNTLVREGFLPAYALAVAEENATGGLIVTAPTCGSCGVLPAVICHIEDTVQTSEKHILRALATAGLIGNLIKEKASISGAEVGCQGEIGSACAMAAGAAAQLMGGTIRQIEYAAEMGLEHHLGLTCDPVNGLVQIPCIERNVFAATRAMDCATFATYSDGSHRVSFDEVVTVMKQTGEDLPRVYRETAEGGLAITYRFLAKNKP